VIELRSLNAPTMKLAQATVAAEHYLHTPVDSRCSVEGYSVHISAIPDRAGPLGYLLFGRPEATRCGNWYGSVEDVLQQRTEVTRWQVLNLARVWLSPLVQGSPPNAWRGGLYYDPEHIPGFVDRQGRFRSTLASTALAEVVARVGYDYLMARPPCFLDEPYQIEWLLSYCDTRLHRGVIYQAAGFELYRTNDRGIQTWRKRLPPLTLEQDAAVRLAAECSPRSRQYRARRAAPRQLEMNFQQHSGQGGGGG
jgi:hypothetical protein